MRGGGQATRERRSGPSSLLARGTPKRAESGSESGGPHAHHRYRVPGRHCLGGGPAAPEPELVGAYARGADRGAKMSGDDLRMGAQARTPIGTLPSVVLRECIGALKLGLQVPVAWAGVFVVCLASVLFGGRPAEYAYRLFGAPWTPFPHELMLDDGQPGSVRWIRIGVTLPWLQIILPALFVLLSAGITGRGRRLGCLASLAVCWWGLVESQVIHAISTRDSDVESAVVSYVSYLVLNLSLLMIAAGTVAAWRARSAWLGTLPAFAMAIGVPLVGRHLPGRAYLADFLSLMGIGVVAVLGAGLAGKVRLHPQASRSLRPRVAADGAAELYDVFISYRRDETTDAARLLASSLVERGHRAFLDLDDLGSHHFDERLARAIESAPNFLVILAPTSLARCSEPGDWLRLELAHAIRTRRNIIPLLKDGFRFPPPGEMPEDIVELPRYNGIPYSTQYFTAMMTKIEEFLVTTAG